MKQGKICYIFGAGDYAGITLPASLCYRVSGDIPGQTAAGCGDFVIAADGGFLFLCEKGVRPDLLVGDFDSIDSLSLSGGSMQCKKGMEYAAFMPQEDCIIRYAAEKDDTDMVLAIQEGMERGYREFRIYGGTGGRFDHTIANIQALTGLASRGARGWLIGKNERMTVIRDSALTIPAGEQSAGYVSVFCLGGHASGVTLKNLKYELANADLTNDTPLGTSNEFIGKAAEICVKDGTLLIVLVYQ